MSIIIIILSPYYFYLICQYKTNVLNIFFLAAIEIVEKELSELIKSPNPQDVQSVKNIKSQLQSKLVANFRRKAIGSHDDVQEMLDNMNQDFKSKFKKVKESNLQAWKVYIKLLIFHWRYKIKISFNKKLFIFFFS